VPSKIDAHPNAPFDSVPDHQQHGPFGEAVGGRVISFEGRSAYNKKHGNSRVSPKSSRPLGFLALGRKPALAGAALVKEMLDVAFFEPNLWRAAVDDAADGRTMAFAKGRNSKEMAKGVVGHGFRLNLARSLLFD